MEENKKMKKNLRLGLSISISAIAILGIIAQNIMQEIVINQFTIYLFLIAIIPWASEFIKSFEGLGVKAEFKEKDDARDYKEYKKTPSLGEHVITKEQKEKEIEVSPLSKDNEEVEILSLKARIHYSKEAGATFLMKIYVNDTIIEGERLINKPQIKLYNDGRESPWFHDNKFLWSLQYSKDFKSNYNDEQYKVVNGDPYVFKFDISNIKPIKDKYILRIVHDSLSEREAHKNSIVIKDIEIY